MFVASSTSIGRGPVFGASGSCSDAELVEDVGDVAGADPAGQLAQLADACRRARPWRSVRRSRLRHVVVDDPPHAAELAQRIEVADERHPRVGGAPVLLEERLRGREHRGEDAGLDRLQAARPARRCRGSRRPATSAVERSTREERVAGVEHLRREHASLRQNSAWTWSRAAADRRRRRDHLRPHRAGRRASRSELVDRRLVEADQRARAARRSGAARPG